VTFSKTPKQKEATVLMANKHKHAMLFGGSRSGKTFIIVRNILIRACKVRSRHVSLRHTFNSIKTSIWMDTLPKVLRICFLGLKCNFNKTDYCLELPNGSEYWFAGLDDDKRVEKILGKEFSTIHFNECSQLDYRAVQVALTRLAEKNNLKKKVYYDQNPPAKNHWSYYLFEKKLNPVDNEPLKNPENYVSMLMNPIDNLENIDEEYLGMLESLPEKERERFLYGRYTDCDDGVAYHAFDIDKHVGTYDFLPGSIMIGMDFNVDPMTAIIGQYYDNCFYVIDEIFLKNSDTLKMTRELLRNNYKGTVYPDSTGKNRKTSGMSDFDILEINGFQIANTRNPFVTDRVNNINRLFMEGRLKINKKCKKLINDLSKVSWKDNKLDQKTDKELTHISDALGYWCWEIDPIQGIMKDRTTIKKTYQGNIDENKRRSNLTGRRF